MSAPPPSRAPGDVQRQLADHRRTLDALGRAPLTNARTATLTLVNAVPLRFQHQLGRPFTNYFHSAPKGAVTSGRIVEGDGDASREIVLTATGYGATISVRVTVY